MSKYWLIFKTSLKQESKTITNSITSVISFVVVIYILKQLWDYIYGSGTSQVISGYTLEMMIWYMIMAEVLSYGIKAREITKGFGNDIKSGKIAYQLNKPYNYYAYQVSNCAAGFVWKLLFLIPTAIIMGIVLLGPIANFSIWYILPILLSLLLAIFLACIIYGIVGLLAFYIEESTPFTWIIQKFVLLLGVFFPPEFFPVWLQKFISYSPIYAMMSGPSKLIANFSWELFLEVSISQVLYISLFLLIGLCIFKKGAKKVSVNGG